MSPKDTKQQQQIHCQQNKQTKKNNTKQKHVDYLNIETI